MALNWQFTDAKRFAALNDSERNLNDAFIWGCLTNDLSGITDKNASEWKWRYDYAVELNGAFYYIDGKPFKPSLEEIRKRIGLTTNVSNKTRKQFVEKQLRIRERILPKQNDQHAPVV